MVKRPGRLFTFGCSMTGYHWPTWANILGLQWEYFENWAKAGVGNTFIFNSVIECDSRNKFTSDDQIFVMWTGLPRIDFYQQEEWKHISNQFAKNNRELPYSCPEGYEILSYPLFAALDQYLSSKELSYKFFTWVPYDTESKAGLIYKDTLSKIQYLQFSMTPTQIKEIGNRWQITLYERLRGKDWPPFDKILKRSYNPVSNQVEKELQEFIGVIESDFRFQKESTNWIDRHPLPLEHLDMLKYIVPELTIESATVDWLNDIEAKIKNGVDREWYTDQTLFDWHLPKARL